MFIYLRIVVKLIKIMRNLLNTLFIALFMTLVLNPATCLNRPIDSENFDISCYTNSELSKRFNDNLNEKLELKTEKAILDIDEYQIMPAKDINSNYVLINKTINNTTDILYAGEANNDTKLFLYEIAVIESRLGYLTTTYTKGGRKGKGVWQIERGAFNATKNIKMYPQLKPYLERLKMETGIDWVNDVKWEHCNYVFYGAVAAHLYLIINDVEAKDTVAERAKQWKRHYNTYKGNGRASDYIIRVKRLNSKVAVNI
jgi:hypothetical protein